MRQKNGFIAVSMIYSFFLVFLMIILATSARNAQTRELLRVFKNDVIKELNQKEFIVIKLSKEDNYTVSQEIDFVGETWQVVENKTDSVVLVLKRALNMEEITSALETNPGNDSFFSNSCNTSSCRIKMCTSKYSNQFCYFVNTSSYRSYRFSDSTIKYVLERWLEKNVNLQKICRWQYDEEKDKRVCQKDTLLEMSFSDGVSTQKGYIRIPTKQEINTTPGWMIGTNAWTLTKEKEVGGKSYVYAFSNSAITSESALEIRPVIEVRKY